MTTPKPDLAHAVAVVRTYIRPRTPASLDELEALLDGIANRGIAGTDEQLQQQMQQNERLDDLLAGMAQLVKLLVMRSLEAQGRDVSLPVIYLELGDLLGVIADQERDQ